MFENLKSKLAKFTLKVKTLNMLQVKAITKKLYLT